MTNRLWLLTACFLVCLPFAAEAQFPKPRPVAAPQATTAPAPALAPETVQATSPTVNVAPPNVSVSPQLVLPPASTLDEIKSWLNTTFLGLLSAIGGWIGLRGIKTAAPTAPGAIPGVDVLLKLKDKMPDPATRAGIDSVILQVVQSGIPGLAIQSGASLVPGVGPFAAQLEPLLRKVVTDVLEKRVVVP